MINEMVNACKEDFYNGEQFFDSVVSADDLASQIRSCHPMVHCYVPVVSANDSANLLLACGASPVLSDNPEEAADITGKCQGLSLSLGMPSQSRWDAIMVSGMTARSKGIPIVLDLTGIGLSRYRTSMGQSVIHACHPDIIKGNVSELGCLCGFGTAGCIDADHAESESAVHNEAFISCLQDYARKHACILVCTGKTDLVISEKGELQEVQGGSSWMARISGTGCMLNAVLAAALAASKEDRFWLAVLTLRLFKNWGAWAARQMKANEGPGSYRMHFLDAPVCMKTGSREEV